MRAGRRRCPRGPRRWPCGRCSLARGRDIDGLEVDYFINHGSNRQDCPSLSAEWVPMIPSIYHNPPRVGKSVGMKGRFFEVKRM